MEGKMDSICNVERRAAALPSALAFQARRQGDLVAGANAGLLMRVLDEIDYGLLLVCASGGLRYANQLGLKGVMGAGPLQLQQGRLPPRVPLDRVPLPAALGDAARGRRRLFSVGPAGNSVSVAAVPMPS